MFSKKSLKKIWETLPPLVWAGFGWFFLCYAIMWIEYIWIKKDTLPKITMAIGFIGLISMLAIVDIKSGKTKSKNQERHQN